MKNIIAVCLLVFVTLIFPREAVASSIGGGGSSFDYDLSTCNYCGGDWQNYWKGNLEDFNCWNCITHSIYGGVVHSCENKVFYIPANGDVKYYFKFQGTNGGNDQVCYVQLSTDNLFEISTVNGPMEVFDAKGYGESNGLFYCYSYKGIAASSNYLETFCTGYNYLVNFDCAIYESEIKNKLIEFAKYLTGESSELPDGASVVTPPPVKDLEAPLEVSVNGIDNNIFETKTKSVKIRWNQSNIDLTGYKTVFYIRESGRCRKTIFNEWQDLSTPWLFDKDYVTAKYCNNNLKYHEYKWWTEQSSLVDYANEKLYGEETGGLLCEHAAVDFMIRNEKEDEDGTLHYSSWVYVNCFEDGTYQVYEMNDDYTLDQDPDETGQINTDSSIYDDETIYDEDDVDASLGIGDATDFLGSMKDLINSLRNFPALFAKIFSFFPSWVLAMIGMLFIAVLLARLFL